MASALFGLETEFGITGLDRSGLPVDLAKLIDQLLTVARRGRPHLPDRHGPGMWGPNGSRFYMDASRHPEYATPECTTPWELVRHIVAGERIIEEAAEKLRAVRPEITKLSVFKGNVDYRDNSWACHENYLHRSNPGAIDRQLLPFLVSRIIYTGSGGFNSFSHGLQFTLSPRVHFIRAVVSESTQSYRGILHMKNEPFTKKGKRLHLHCGESLCSHRGMWLKAGTTALVLSVIDAGKRPGEAVQLDSPLAAMKKFTVDPTCTARAPLTNGDAWTAIEIQRHYLRSVQEQLGVLSLPSWAEEVCIEWGRILDLLGGAPDSVATTLDWGIKYALYKNHARSAGIEMRTFPLWTYVCSRLVGAVPADGKPYTVKMGIEGDLRAEPEKVRLSRLLDNKGFSWDQALMFLKLQKNLYEIDIKFSQLGPSGIFSQLDAGGVLDHRVPGVERIEEAIAEPPESSRAFIRGKEIQRLASQMASEENPDKSPSLGLLVDWDRIVDAKKGRALNLDDPFESEVHWQNIMMSDRRRAALAGPEELRPLDESPF